MTNGASGSGWYQDPSDPKLDRYFDGTRWTDLTRKGERRRDTSGGGGAGSRAVIIAIVGVLALGGIAMAWYLITGTRDITDEAAGVITEAPAQADAAAMKADARTVAINVTTAVVDTGALPSVALVGREYVVTDANGAEQSSAATQGVTSVIVTGTADSFCVQVSAADGQAAHVPSGGSPQDGPCP